MKWFDRWFARKCKWAWDHKEDILEDVPLATQSLRGAKRETSWSDGLQMNVKKIIGGYVVSFHIYDRAADRVDDRHYMITDEQDFERELGKIITLESMRKA